MRCEAGESLSIPEMGHGICGIICGIIMSNENDNGNNSNDNDDNSKQHIHLVQTKNKFVEMVRIVKF